MKIPSGICAKLRTVAARNNRVHMPWSLYYCLFAPRICMVLFFTHIPFVVDHTINATPPERLQQHTLHFTMNCTNRTFFVWRMNSARPSHPGHSTILLRSEIPSVICAKLCTVAARNNRVHMPWSLYYCLFAPCICMVLFFTHIPFVVNHTINATPLERLQQYCSEGAPQKCKSELCPHVCYDRCIWLPAFSAIFSASLLLTLVHSGVNPPLVVKTRGLNEGFSMSITLCLYLSFFLFHVVGRSLLWTSQNKTMR